MRTTTKANVHVDSAPHCHRRDGLRRLLEDRRRELATILHDRMRVVNPEHGADVLRQSLDEGEASELNVQEDIELALIQMKGETLAMVREALERLDAGLYGHCASCGDDIAASRLRALPFAVRCRECETLLERDRQRARTAAGADLPRHWHGSGFLGRYGG